jgi:putative tryptophan/tyrosine transport system substrate-binding protein
MLAAPIAGPFAAAFRDGLKELGYIEGRTIRLEFRTTDGRPERLPGIAAEIVGLKPDVILAGGGGPSVRAAKKLTSTIPIVVPATANPVAEGFVQSLARPGGNVTGLSIVSEEINAKRIQLLKELLPNVRSVAFLADPQMGSMNADAAILATEHAAQTFGLELRVFRASAPEQFDGVFESIRNRAIEAVIVGASSTYNVHRKRLVGLAAKQRIPVMWEHRQFATAGGLLSYGPDIAELYRGAARYVDRILKGAKVAELPVEQATKFELVLNIATAKAQGIDIPPTVLARANQVIQ